MMFIFIQANLQIHGWKPLLDPDFISPITSLSKVTLSGHNMTISHDWGHIGAHHKLKTAAHITKLRCFSFVKTSFQMNS